MPDIVVVGSLNLDVTVPLDTLPGLGQTVLGGDHLRGGGGKGGNQAVAAARLGRSVAMVAAVGADAEGDRLLDILAAEGVDTTAVLRATRPTGQALVLVTADGDSTIVVSPGANMWLAPEHLRPVAGVLSGARCLLLQHEISAPTVAAAVAAATGLVVLNPAPARPVDPAVLARVDVLVPNRGELAALVGVPVPEQVRLDELAGMARALGVRGQVVVTLGADGAVVVDADGYTLVPARPVRAVDATAAGDSFCAALADGLLAGQPIVEAARWATRVAAVTVTRPGAMDSLPHRAEV
ncbi:ribokinase [Micromonospora echinofusca]|uniref:Ribokinase n=1 Tax=Micromonospora echinofusca TaxID=47858 RepID=A0ABS3VV99_MICEH|nr:ribokinase [Micromonospora echinofusca]MBO4208323.1 ribokinase [Micromonospora echinofusca]